MVPVGMGDAGCATMDGRLRTPPGGARRWLVPMAFGCLALLSALWVSASGAATRVDAGTIVRQTLEKGPVGASSIAEKALPVSEVNTIVFDKLDSRLNHACIGMQGKRYQFAPAGQRAKAEVVVLLLDYPDGKIANSMSRRLEAIGGFLRQTQVLTPFSYAVSGSRLVVVFTESDNVKVVRFVEEFPKTLR